MITLYITLLRFFRGLQNGFRDAEFRALTYFVILLLVGGTIFYSSVEHFKILDAFYFSVTTLSTVGLGDLAPRTDIGKIFTTLYIFVGVGTLLTFVNLLATHANGKHKKETKKREVN